MSQVAPTTVRNSFGLEERLGRSALEGFVERWSGTHVLPRTACRGVRLLPVGADELRVHQDPELLAAARELIDELEQPRVLQVILEEDGRAGWVEPGDGASCDVARVARIRCEAGWSLGLVNDQGDPVTPNTYDVILLCYVLDRLEPVCTLPLLTACREVLAEEGRLVVIGFTAGRDRRSRRQASRLTDGGRYPTVHGSLLAHAGFTVVARQLAAADGPPSELVAGIDTAPLGEELPRSA
jgi:hypothetical protein